MTSDRERAVKLREAGLFYPEIAQYLGRSTSTIYRWVNPASDESHRVKANAWKKANPQRVRDYNKAFAQSRCPDCNGPMHRVSKTCMACRHAAENARFSLIEGMWLDGWSLREIAEALDSTVNSLCVTFDKLRKRGGWDLPYRYNVSAGRRVAA